MRHYTRCEPAKGKPPRHYTRRDFDKTMGQATPDWFTGIVIGTMVLITVLAGCWLSGGM